MSIHNGIIVHIDVLQLKQTYYDYNKSKTCICEAITNVCMNKVLFYNISKLTIDDIEYNYINIFFENSNIYGVIS